MKTFNNLYSKIYDFNNLHNAYLAARKNKRYKSEVIEFGLHLEENLIQIQNELMHHTYQPSRYREFIIKEPKERLILALPFRDRVVHQAICKVIEPIFDSTFIYDTYACRKGKGTLAGVKRLWYFLNKMQTNNSEVFCLKMDITKYFYSIRHNQLKEAIARKFRCKETMNLLNVIIDSTDDPGIPVGNLTSQLFANVYLSKLDHFIKGELRRKYYIRYMDDMIMLGNNKSELWNIYSEIKSFLELELGLSFNKKTQVFNVKRGIDFLGYRQFPNRLILRKRVLKKNYKKFKKLSRTADAQKIERSLASFEGLCKHCSSKKILNDVYKILGEHQNGNRHIHHSEQPSAT